MGMRSWCALESINMNWTEDKVSWYQITFHHSEVPLWLRYNSIYTIFKISFSWGKSTAACSCGMGRKIDEKLVHSAVVCTLNRGFLVQ